MTARATNQDTEGSRDQVIVRIGRAPGFDPRVEDLEQLVWSGLRRGTGAHGRRDLYLMVPTLGNTRARVRSVPALAWTYGSRFRDYAYTSPACGNRTGRAFVASSRCGASVPAYSEPLRRQRSSNDRRMPRSVMIERYVGTGRGRAFCVSDRRRTGRTVGYSRRPTEVVQSDQ